jgi:hypothetical protein
MHMAVEASFWFHPLVWWIGAREVDERERACDEAVLRAGSQPSDYAEGILTVCRWSLASPVMCVSGITGSDLRTRIETIMANRVGRRLNAMGRMLLASPRQRCWLGRLASVCSTLRRNRRTPRARTSTSSRSSGRPKTPAPAPISLLCLGAACTRGTTRS